MEVIVYFLWLALGGLILGALARLALPGPDPMGIGMTILVGLGGSIAAGLVVWAITGERETANLLVAFAFSVLIVYLIRRSRGGTLTDPGINYRR